MSTPKINYTTDLGMFQMVVGNRQIQPTHLASLIASIRNKNMLQYNPIIVNEDMQVIDGQHRLIAVQRLNEGVYYVVGKGLTLADVIKFNTTARQWRLDDYLDSYIAQGYEDYALIKKFAKKYGLSHSNALAILHAGADGYISAPYKAFKEGKFEIKDLDASKEFAGRVKEIAPYTDANAWADREFLQALHMAYYKFEVDHDTLLRRIKSFGSNIQRRHFRRDYLRQLEDRFSFGMQKQARFY